MALSTVTSLESSNSFNLLDALKKSDSSNLLTVSVSISLSSSPSLWSIGDTPSFSSVCKEPYRGPAFLVMAFDELRRPTLSNERGVTISIPTAPRLGNVVVERRCVSRWTEKISSKNLPEHIPWDDLPETPELDWTPEGSVIPHRKLKEALAEVHGKTCPSNVFVEPSSPIDSVPASPSLWNKSHKRSLSASKREAQVLGNELSMSGRQSLTLGVPPALMSPQIVDLLCEITESQAEQVVNEPTTPVRDATLRPPTLMVSTSTAVIPISLSSSHSLGTSGSPPPIPPPLSPLAIRRGKKQLAPLDIAKAVDPTSSIDAYPGIPTAFLGSPSPTAYTHSPGIDFFAPTLRTVDMQLDEMLADLRARAAALPPGRHTGPTLSEKSTDSPPASGSSGSSSDEWGTVDSLLETYHRDAVRSPTGGETSPKLYHIWNMMPASPTESESSTPASEDDGITGKVQVSAPIQAFIPTANRSCLSASPERDSMSGPLRPSRLSGPPKRGILKTTKVVRFIDPPGPPEERVQPALQDSSNVPSHGLQVQAMGAIPKKPSPLRQSIPTTPGANRDSHSSLSSEASSPPSFRTRPTPPVRRSLESGRPARPLTPVQTNRRHTVSTQQRFATMPHSRASMKENNKPPVHAVFKSCDVVTNQRDENAARREEISGGKVAVESEKKGRKIRPFKSLLGKLKG
ncbi:hypothetical protein NEOLEDRAFT_1146314 [Neolentinus lepideus HHB14362 ss-1]|uniref:Uncharacterized protein n=1 Tax=Neolentinus lepideus HHB14362 ss-1 TaxID=1314782 RepID=A0A165UBG4_9AGAM|nr:hypothetical protein NEOLEDRAFT_1146314 [Neolentinus lepideus HHB14362 ss-1]